MVRQACMTETFLKNLKRKKKEVISDSSSTRQDKSKVHTGETLKDISMHT